MFAPSDLNSTAEFDKWTKPLTDCAIKLGVASSSTSSRRRLSGNSNINTAALQEMVTEGVCASSCATSSSSCGGNGPGASNYVLQWLEEGLADLGCLIDPTLTINEPDRCAAARERLGVASDGTPDCWVAGWEDIFGVTAPVSSLDSYVCVASLFPS